MPLRPPSDAEDKLRDIRAVTDAALSHLGAADLLTTLLSRVREILNADTAAVLLLDNSGRQLIATAASGLEEEVSQGVRIPVGQGFAGRIAAERQPVILDHVDHGNVLNPLLLDKGIRSLAGVPLLVHGTVLGVLHVGTVHDRVFTAEDAALLQLAADRAATAVQSLRSREDHAAAVALQRSLVPSALPGVRGAEVAARYVPGSGHVGGDWYDAFDPDSGQLRISSAGHFPPVIAAPGRRGAMAEIAVDPPIGVANVACRQVTTLTLAPGAVLCLFTDGLVERRDEPIDEGIIRLCETVTPGPPEGVCVSIMQALVGSQYPGDDIALLVLRWMREQAPASTTPPQGERRP